MSEINELMAKICGCLGLGKEEEAITGKRPIDEIKEEQKDRPPETTLLYVNSLNKLTTESVKGSIGKGLSGNVEIVKDIAGDIKDKLSKKEWKHLQDRVYRIKLALGEE